MSVMLTRLSLCLSNCDTSIPESRQGVNPNAPGDEMTAQPALGVLPVTTSARTAGFYLR
jgi:hypothetical protein